MMSAQAPAMQNPLVAGKLGQSRRFLLLDANAINPFSATTQADDDTTSYLHPLFKFGPSATQKKCARLWCAPISSTVPCPKPSNLVRYSSHSNAGWVCPIACKHCCSISVIKLSAGRYFFIDLPTPKKFHLKIIFWIVAVR